MKTIGSCLVLLLGVLAVACGGATPVTQPVTPPEEARGQDTSVAAETPATVAGDDTSGTAPSSTGPCTPATGSIKVSFPRGYSTMELLTWYMDVTCANILLPRRALDRRTARPVTLGIAASEASDTLQTLLGHLQLTAMIMGVTVLVLPGDDAGDEFSGAMLGIVSNLGDAPLLGGDEDNNPLTDEKPATTEEEATPTRLDDTEHEKALARGIRKIDETHYAVKRELVDQVLADPMSVARGARIVPSMKDGKTNGFKLYAIRPSSIYARLGLRNGDTLYKVNDFEISTPDKALEVYSQLRSSSHLELSLIRRGKSVLVVIDIE